MLRCDSLPAASTETPSTIATTATMPTTRHRQPQERRTQPRDKRNAQTSAQHELIGDIFSQKSMVLGVCRATLTDRVWEKVVLDLGVQVLCRLILGASLGDFRQRSLDFLRCDLVCSVSGAVAWYRAFGSVHLGGCTACCQARN